jgi:hypothetical protein
MVTDVEKLKQQAKEFITVINQIEIENAAAVRSRESLENTINALMEQNKNNKEALDIGTHAIEIIRKVSDEAVGEAYKFLEQSLNSALAKMFTNTTRKIELKESTRANQYPQLEIILHVGNGKTRSLKSDSGHGLAQIVSLLSILSLIVITGSRRILVMDEIISGLSVHNRKIVNDILWTFTGIGFQFICNEHGYIPAGSKVFHLEMVGDVSHVKKTYIAQKGVYLQSDGETEYDYSEKEQNINDMIVNSGGEAVNNQTETTEATTDVSVETNESDNILSI